MKNMASIRVWRVCQGDVGEKDPVCTYHMIYGSIPLQKPIS